MWFLTCPKFLLLVRWFQKGIYYVNNFSYSYQLSTFVLHFQILSETFHSNPLPAQTNLFFLFSWFSNRLLFFILQTLTGSAFSFSFFLLLHFQYRLFLVLGALSSPMWTLISCCCCFADMSVAVCRMGESAMLGPWLWGDPPPAPWNLPCKYWRGGKTHGGADILIHTQ